MLTYLWGTALGWLNRFCQKPLPVWMRKSARHAKRNGISKRYICRQQESHTYNSIPLPESSDCSHSDMMETSPGHTGDTGSNSEESSTNHASCKVLRTTLLEIHVVKIINHKWGKIYSQERSIQEILDPEKLENTVRKQLGAYSSVHSRQESPRNKLSTAVRQLRYNNPTSPTYQTKHSKPYQPTSNTNQPSTSKDSATSSQFQSPGDWWVRITITKKSENLSKTPDRICRTDKRSHVHQTKLRHPHSL